MSIRFCMPVVVSVLLGACTDRPGLPDVVDAFRLTFVGANTLGTPDSPRPFSTDWQTPDDFNIDIEALQGDAVDTSFNGWVVLGVRPEVVSCGEVVAPDPPAVKLVNGVARNVKVSVIRAYCTARLVAIDEGYVKSAGLTDSKCLNGVDDDGDGYIDFPGASAVPGINHGDRGCFLPTDDSEEGGTGAAGASAPIYFRCPLIRDIQEPDLGKTGNESPLRGCRATVDRGWMLVTRVGVDGLYVTDFEGARWDPAKQNWTFAPEDLSYDAVFVYNYSTPLNLQEGDCLTQIDGTVDEFYGFTELTKPTWKKGDFAFCAAKARLAGLTECPTSNAGADTPAGKLCRSRIEQLANSPVDLTTLMVKDSQGIDRSVWDNSHVASTTERFESAIVKVSNVKMFTEARACDFNSNGLIDYYDDTKYNGETEKGCSNDCGNDKQCIVLETYHRYNQWTVHFDDGEGVEREVAVVTAGSIQAFDPLAASKGTTPTQPRQLDEVVGTLRHLIFGRPPFTIEARRPSDCPTCTN